MFSVVKSRSQSPIVLGAATPPLSAASSSGSSRNSSRSSRHLHPTGDLQIRPDSPGYAQPALLGSDLKNIHSADLEFDSPHSSQVPRSWSFRTSKTTANSSRRKNTKESGLAASATRMACSLDDHVNLQAHFESPRSLIGQGAEIYSAS
ncbi:MAG: hypothetical protein A2428_13600 [Bdellovibrionales bacterium RIFOXYC1_FULL_54_43]|nr:MAG: hypothetical protein A2428_13600 [Bdellovibrionales bacterium RIFOXYC1_FULL_54_43]OFZ83176.1 MAG: hypothetical protein A2603_00340 [Bdellovibrionales bacterium RIFOXYD1_FULL_55_31]